MLLRVFSYLGDLRASIPAMQVVSQFAGDFGVLLRHRRGKYDEECSASCSRIHPPLLTRANLITLRWESPGCRCAGITDGAKQETNVFKDRGTVISVIIALCVLSGETHEFQPREEADRSPFIQRIEVLSSPSAGGDSPEVAVCLPASSNRGQGRELECWTFGLFQRSSTSK